MSYFNNVSIRFADTASIDAFSRLRVSQPEGLFDSQLTYNLSPLSFEAITNGSGATVTHDTTNRDALLTFSSTPTGGKAYMQSYEYIPYQPGKALRHGEPVLTVNGWENIENLKVGDKIFDGLGNKTDIIGVYPQGDRDIYRITFDDGTYVDPDGEHLWKTIIRENSKTGKELILTTNQMLEKHGEAPSGFNRWRIPASPVLNIKNRKIPIDAYTLGVILGDGHIQPDGFVQYTTADIEILKYIKCDGISTYSKKYHYGLKGLSNKIKNLGLAGRVSNDKFVPHKYLYNSKENRLAILQGLMDTDGSVDKKDGTCEFNSASKELADNISFLVRSLGGQAKTKQRESFYISDEGEKIQCQDSYRVRVIMPTCPFRLKRKILYWKPRTRISFDRYIHTIKPIGRYKATCIRVNSKDHTFLTRNNIVTHNSQAAFVTFNMNGGVANVLKFAGLSDGVNGIELQLNGTQPQFQIYSGTGNGNDIALQANWNLDVMNGTGASGINIDFSKVQILVIDFQALYVGRVRVGFDVGGLVYFAHQFVHSNIITTSYIQSANLPVRCGMTCTGTVSTTMDFICSSVMSEGGSTEVRGRSFAAEGTVTAGNNTRTHILSIRPKTTFNSITNRIKFELNSVNMVVTGTSSVLWELCVGQVITGTTAFNDVNTTYSGFAFNTAGTISGSPTIVIASGYTGQATGSGAGFKNLSAKYPITLDAAGAIRALGTLSVIVTGLGATSACRCSLNWREIR